MLPPEFDDTLLGVGERFGSEAIAVYDKAKVLSHLETQHHMTPEDAYEYFEYNILGAYMGDVMPIFVSIN